LLDIYFTQRNLLLSSKQQKKMIGYHTSVRENDDLPLWRGQAVKKKPPFFNARALITREIMRSRDAQCNTGE